MLDAAPLLARVTRDHGAYLRGYARHLCRGHGDADDLVQDALVAALTRREPLVGELDARAWLTTVMRHRFVDGCRRRATRRKLTAALDAVPPADDDDDATAAWWRDLDTDAVRAQLAALPPGLAAPFALFTLDRLSYRAIALRLGIPVATVGTRILRARQRLRTRLTACHAPGDSDRLAA